jgi:L-lactate utilization protein LutB
MSEPVAFLTRAEALIGTHEAAAVNRGVSNFARSRVEVIEELPEFDAYRDRARAIRLHALANLDRGGLRRHGALGR